MHLVGLIKRIYHDARSPERQIHDRITDCDSFDAQISLDFADKKKLRFSSNDKERYGAITVLQMVSA